MKMLENINEPADVRKMARSQLTPLAHELRNYLLESATCRPTWARWS
jgi:1-deoxy-D-xylulose-5-phosphate synthase